MAVQTKLGLDEQHDVAMFSSLLVERGKIDNLELATKTSVRVFLAPEL